MSQTLKSVQEFYDEAPTTDISEIFGTWMELVDGLKAKVADRFDLTRDPSTDVLESFGGENGGPTGRIRAYAGPEIDWMVHSHMENAKQGFANIHLTIWLGPQVKVPHFGLALGAFPQAWIFVDSVPRTNLLTDTDSFDRYYGPLNAEWEQVQQENDFLEPFVSRSGFVRASLSPMAHAYTAPTDSRTTDVVSQARHRPPRPLAPLGRRGRAGARPRSRPRSPPTTWRPAATSPTATPPTRWATGSSART